MKRKILEVILDLNTGIQQEIIYLLMSLLQYWFSAVSFYFQGQELYT